MTPNLRLPPRSRTRSSTSATSPDLDALSIFIILYNIKLRLQRMQIARDQERETMKVELIGGLLTDVVTRLEQRAEQSAQRLQKAHDRVISGADNMDQVSVKLEAAATSIEGAVNRITNGAPPLAESSSSSGS